jgi:transcription initiation factor IIF auxiliary subunit
MYKNGEVHHLKHMLAFNAPPVEAPLPINAQNVAVSVGKNRWQWTVFIRGSSSDLDKIRCVEYTLHPTFPKPVQEVTRRGADSRAFAFTAIGWGTFKIRIRVFLKNGQVQHITHDLTF